MVTGQVGPSGDLVGDVLTVTVELTDAQIKALPTTPAIIVPATETLNYSGFPSQIPLVISATILLNNIAGAYTADPEAYLVIAMGSDWSYNLTQKSTNTALINAGLSPVVLASRMLVSVTTTPQTSYVVPETSSLNDAVLDNAIVLAASNSGDFTGGNEANRAWIVLTYQLLEVT